MPQIIQGGTHTDERGKLVFFNEFDMARVKRFYVIEPAGASTVRAWQGHKKEEKWFYVISGSFKVVLVQPDDWESPSVELATEEFELAASKPQVLHVPGGYANGFRSLEAGSKIMVFSPFTVEESAGDDYRFDKGLWYDW
ncbi:MAG: WxcM-like domain-containing protein [Ginsengibacter sp.]